MRLHVKDLQPNTLRIASKDDKALAGIRQLLELNNFSVTDMKPTNDPVEGMFFIHAASENSGKVREFLSKQEGIDLHG